MVERAPGSTFHGRHEVVRCLGAALASLAFAILSAQPARAQEADVHALAVQLFDEAGRAQDRHAYDEACPKFARIVEMEPAKVGAKLALADCYEQAGKLASALLAYRAASARAAEVSDPRQKLADEKTAALEAKAPRLTLRIPDALGAVRGLTILRDGLPFDAWQWNRAILADPGEHAIYVQAPGKKPWSGKVTVTTGSTTEVVIGALEDLSPPAAIELAPPRPPPPPTRTVPAWAWVTGALGLASGGAAVGFAVDQAATQRDFDAQCKNAPRVQATCDGEKTRLWRDFGLAVGLGAAGVAALAVPLIRIASGAPQREPVRASFWVAPQGGGATLGGRF